MSRFVDRQKEIRELNELLNRPGTGQFLAVYGRRRVGKTTLLLHWARTSQRPFLYWIARRETPDAVRQSLARALWGWAYPGAEDAEPPRFDNWEILFRQMGRMIDERAQSTGPLIMIWDEFPYAAQSDPSLPSHLQAAWDHLFKDKPVILILAGSHIGMMVDLMAYQAPLFGRFTAQLSIKPLPFYALKEFFPGYEAAERVATYATLGGVPAYLERFDPDQNLGSNIRRHLFQGTGMFRNEPWTLISDLVRETTYYETMMRSIANGNHTLGEISKDSGIASPNLSPYLKRLRELYLIERRLPATMPPVQRRSTTKSRYYLSDPYLRFYFRFIEPNLEMIEMGWAETLWERIGEQFRSFVGATTFEELCREWILAAARARKLPFLPEIVGSHWATDAQVDVVAVNWQEKKILLGECKWGVDALNRSVVRELVEKTPKVLPEGDWQTHYAFFSRAGFTEVARDEAQSVNALLVDLATLDADLSQNVL